MDENRIHRLIAIKSEMEKVIGFSRAHHNFPRKRPTSAEIEATARTLNIHFPVLYLQILDSLFAQGLPLQFSLYWIGAPADDEIITKNREIRAEPVFPGIRQTEVVSFTDRFVAFADDFFQHVFAFDLESDAGPESNDRYQVVSWGTWGEISARWSSFEQFIDSELDRLEQYLEQWGRRDEALQSLKLKDFDTDWRELASSLPDTRPVMIRQIQAELLAVARYLEAGAIDPLVREFRRSVGITETFLEKFYSGVKGIELVTEHLIAHGDRERLRKLWTGRTNLYIKEYRRMLTARNEIEVRYRDTHKEEALTCLGKYAVAAEQLDDAQARSEIEQMRLQVESGSFPEPALASPDNRKIDDELFWELIRRATEGAEGVDEKLERLVFELTAFGSAQIKQFKKILNKWLCELYHWDLWALAYLRNGGCSDDGFEYFRAGLILEGKHTVETLLQSVNAGAALLPQGGTLEAEGLLAVASEAHERKVKKPLNISSGRCKIKGTEWDEDEVADRYQELHGILMGERRRGVR